MKTIELKRVLITMDFNPTAQKVAEIGYSFAKSLDAEVILLHVVVDPLYYNAVENFPITDYSGSLITPFQNQNQLLEDPKKESNMFLDRIKQHLGDDNIKTLVKEGDFADVILKTATELGVDVIVMGSHSRRWLDEILMGSVTADVLHRTTIPLFIIPTQKTKE